MSGYKRRPGRNIKIVSREALIKEIAAMTDYYQKDISVIYAAFEKILVDHLMESDRDTDVEVCLSKGIKLLSGYVPSKDKFVPNWGTVHIQEGLEFSSRFAKDWRQKRCAEYREMRQMLDELEKSQLVDTEEKEKENGSN